MFSCLRPKEKKQPDKDNQRTLPMNSVRPDISSSNTNKGSTTEKCYYCRKTYNIVNLIDASNIKNDNNKSFTSSMS